MLIPKEFKPAMSSADTVDFVVQPQQLNQADYL